MGGFVGHDYKGYTLTVEDVPLRDRFGHAIAVGDIVLFAHLSGPGGLSLYYGQVVGGGINQPVFVRSIDSVNSRPLPLRSAHLVFHSDQYRDTNPALLAEIFNEDGGES